MRVSFAAIKWRAEAGVAGEVGKIHPFFLWLRASGRSQKAAALALGLSRPYLSMVLSGRERPSSALAERMAAWTQGAVSRRRIAAWHRRFPPSGKPRRP